MPSENQMWTALRPHLMRLGMDPVRVENPALPGTPDVNFIEGWTELKHADRWPVRGGPLRLKHPPQPQQMTWLARRWAAGGNCWLTLRVGREWLLFRGETACRIWSDSREDPPDRAELLLEATATYSSPREVAEHLKRGRGNW